MADTWRLSRDGYLVYNNRKLSFGEVLIASNGMATLIDGTPVGLLVQQAVNTLKVGGVPANELVTVDNILDLLPIAPSPVLDIPTGINENEEISVNITNHVPGTVYEITVDKGTISNINNTNGTFKYRAPDISDGVDTTDTITIYGSVVGKVRSNLVTYNLNIVYVPIIGDTALSNADFNTNKYFSTNFKF